MPIFMIRGEAGGKLLFSAARPFNITSSLADAINSATESHHASLQSQGGEVKLAKVLVFKDRQETPPGTDVEVSGLAEINAGEIATDVGRWIVLQYQLPEPEPGPPREQADAFSVLSKATSKRVLPIKQVNCKLDDGVTDRYDWAIYNAVIDQLQKNELGFPAELIHDQQPGKQLLLNLQGLLTFVLPFDERGVFRERACHIPERFTSAKLNVAASTKHNGSKSTVERLSTERLMQRVNLLYMTLERLESQGSWHRAPGWASFLSDVRTLCTRLAHYADGKLEQAQRSAANHARTQSTRDPTAAKNLDYFLVEGTRNPSLHPSLWPLAARLGQAEMYEPVLIDDSIMGVTIAKPSEPPSAEVTRKEQRRDFMNGLQSHGGPFQMMVHVFHQGGPKPSVRYCWRVPSDEDVRAAAEAARDAALRNDADPFAAAAAGRAAGAATMTDPVKEAAAVAKAAGGAPVTSTRTMRAEFFARFAPTGLHQAVLHEMHRFLTGDTSAAKDAKQLAIDKRVVAWLNSGGDPEHYYDWRDLNGNDGLKFSAFWDEAATYLELEIGTGAEPRREASDGSLGYASTLVSVPSFIREVTILLRARAGHEKDPIPSPSCVALQFHPRCPTHLSAGRFSSRFKVKRQVQSRILRKCNPDSHACNALAKYQKTKTVEVRDLARELDAKRAAGLCLPCMHAHSTLTACMHVAHSHCQRRVVDAATRNAIALNVVWCSTRRPSDPRCMHAHHCLAWAPSRGCVGMARPVIGGQSTCCVTRTTTHTRSPCPEFHAALWSR